MLQKLIQALQDDHALSFDLEGAIIPDQGWMFKYVSDFVAYVNDEIESYMMIHRSDLPIDDYDEKDMRIIAHKVGYHVNITDRMIMFEIV